MKKLLEIIHTFKPSDNFEIIADDSFSCEDDDDMSDDDDDMSDDDDVSDDDVAGGGGDAKRFSRGGGGGGGHNPHYVAVKKANGDGSEKDVNNYGLLLCYVIFISEMRFVTFMCYLPI